MSKKYNQSTHNLIIYKKYQPVNIFTSIKTVNIGFFTDCWEPQINGVVVSMKNLKTALEKRGHRVFIYAPLLEDGERSNAYIFPGVGLGVTVARASRVTDGMFLDGAKALALMVTQKDLDETAVYPDLTRIRDCSHAVACATIQRAVKEGHADKEILENLEETVRQAMWVPEYLPIRYES